MASNIPADYVVLDGCHNCKHTENYEELDFEIGIELSCDHEPPAHPTKMGYRIHLEWADGRKVSPGGKCPQWKERG